MLTHECTHKRQVQLSVKQEGMDSVRRIFGALLGDIERESEAVKQDPAAHLAATVVSVRKRRAHARLQLAYEFAGPLCAGMGKHTRQKSVVSY